MPLAKLQKVELRSVWKSESSHFTPWLADEENISLLSKLLNIELEVVGQEERVGPFRADILCRDTENDHFVLIENQFEYTDHKHLGQLLTYAAGLDAVSILWVAERFTEEHRAAMDWLNRVTAEGINFFAIEIELYKIGDSETAPRFNLVSKPNDWAKYMRSAARAAANYENKQLQLEYWTGFKNALAVCNPGFEIREASANYYYLITFGRNDARIRVFLKQKENAIGVSFVLRGDQAKKQFTDLKTQYEIEALSTFNNTLEWDFDENRTKQNIINWIDNIDINRKDLWEEQYEKIKNNVLQVFEFFGPKI